MQDYLIREVIKSKDELIRELRRQNRELRGEVPSESQQIVEDAQEYVIQSVADLFNKLVGKKWYRENTRKATRVEWRVLSHEVFKEVIDKLQKKYDIDLSSKYYSQSELFRRRMASSLFANIIEPNEVKYVKEVITVMLMKT